MKKENKELAKQRRAAEREKAAKRTFITKKLKFWVPLILVIAIVIVVIAAIATSGDNGTAANDADASDADTSLESSDTYNEDDETAALNTTPGIAVENGDVVNIDYTGYIDGETFSGGSTNGMGTDLEIGSGSYIEGFEEGVIGHTIGETFDLNLSFPDDYWSEDYAGKDVVFTTTINGIYE